MSELKIGQFNLIKAKKAFEEAKGKINDILGNLHSNLEVVQKKDDNYTFSTILRNTEDVKPILEKANVNIETPLRNMCGYFLSVEGEDGYISADFDEIEELLEKCHKSVTAATNYINNLVYHLILLDLNKGYRTIDLEGELFTELVGNYKNSLKEIESCLTLINPVVAEFTKSNTFVLTELNDSGECISFIANLDLTQASKFLGDNSHSVCVFDYFGDEITVPMFNGYLKEVGWTPEKFTTIFKSKFPEDHNTLVKVFREIIELESFKEDIMRIIKSWADENDGIERWFKLYEIVDGDPVEVVIDNLPADKKDIFKNAEVEALIKELNYWVVDCGYV